MKKLVLFLMAMSMIGGVAHAQVNRFNAEALQKKAAESDRNLQNPKKNSKVNYWLERGDTYYGLGAGMIDNIYFGQHKNETFMFNGKPKEVGNATVDGRNFQTMKYPTFTIYLEDDKIVMWTIDVVFDENALEKSKEAYLKALSMNEKIAPRVKEGLSKIGNFYLKEANYIYLPQKRNKEAAISFGKSYDIHKLPIINRIDTLSAYNAGFISVLENNFEYAVKYLQELDKLGYHKDGDVHYYLYHSYKATGNEAEAEKYMKKGAEMYPNHIELKELLINSYMTSDKDIKDILAEIDQAIANDPKNAAYYFYKAMLLEKTGDVEGALSMFKRVLEFQPNEFHANYNTGVIYTRMAEKLSKELNEIPYTEQKRYDEVLKQMEDLYLESLKYYEKAYEADSKNLDVLEILKRTYYYFRDKKDGMMYKYTQINEQIEAMTKEASQTQERLQSM